MTIKIALLNLCLGLPNKKNIVKQLILNNDIDVLCLQETEIDSNIDHNLMSFIKYNYESESNNIRSRVGCYINSSLNYIRRSDLEENDLHLLIIDIKSIKNLRKIIINKPFDLHNNINPRTFFKNQLHFIRRAYTQNTILLGDFNLDWKKRACKNMHLTTTMRT
jgi:exonuclease III